jgi:gliding motility-associated-like protein
MANCKTYKLKTILIALSVIFSYTNSIAQVQANFSGNPLSGCMPLLVNFTNLSTGAVSYQWDLGNGTQSTIGNPSATYFNPGTYTISLIATAANGQKDTMVKTQYITVFAKPTVNFTASDTIGCYPLTTQFTDGSIAGSGAIVSWQWDFGDGSSSTLQNPVHTYQQGTYSVVLRVTNDKGCNTTILKPNYIRALNGIQAGFSFISPNTCNLPVTINFTNTSTGTGILNYNWNFGDGGTSALQNPSHTYTVNGSFHVVLTTTNNQGCSNTYTVNNAISIGNNTAAFLAPDSICEDVSFSLTNASNPIPGSVLWNFGDGTISTQMNPVKLYANPGNYLIKLVSNFGACKDSVSKPITVLAKPSVNFAADQTTSCSTPFAVNFNSIASGVTTYSWNFGDGGTSALPNPSHTYTAAGEYDVTLIATNVLGCSDTVKKIKLIRISPPALSFLNLPDSGCNPLTILPLTMISSVDGIASFSWTFGDGFISSAANPVHTYTTAGTYAIKLIITTNGGCVDSISSFVKVGSKPNVQFSATPTNSCAFQQIHFSDASTGAPANFWFWQFGDGNTSYLPNPAYAYQDTGFFTVTLIVGNNGCYDTLVKPNYIYINPPIARFTPVNNCTSPLTWSFTDQSIMPLTWSWNFGDGTFSTTPSPTHTYAVPGNYYVTLLVTNGSCTHEKTTTIHVIDENPDFSSNAQVVCKNSVLNFTSFGYLRSNISAITWNFGDGNIVAGDSLMSHIYTQAGVFTVSLIMTDLNGCTDTVTKNLYITVFGPTANFVSTVPGTCLNTAVGFNDLSVGDGTHPIVNWEWNYGDGSVQTYTNPPFQHQYAASGVYTIKLKVTDNNGCTDSIVKPGYLVISKPIAGFYSPDTLFCPLRDLFFTNTSVGINLTYLWDFGDGTFSTATNPVHQYAADGVYSINLVVTDQYGCVDSFRRVQYIWVVTPVANFTVSDSFSTCPPLFVQFTNTSVNFTSIAWDFGDGSNSTAPNPTHFYTTPGNFVAKLTVTTTGGCTSIVTKTIRVQGPSGVFSYSPLTGCKPLTINLIANTINANSYIWDFNNGQTISGTNSSISYTYTQAGKFLPRLILKDNAGCSIPILGTDSITVFGVSNTLNASNLILCDSGSVQFNSSPVSNDVINNYLWNFGDGFTDTQQNPTHSYNSTGNFAVQCITTTQQGCKDTSLLQVPVHILRSPEIAVTGPNGACIPASAQFLPQIIYNDTSTLNWQWNFGNGQTSGLMNPPAINFPSSGTYTITCVTTNSSGCKDSVSSIFNAWALPVINAGTDQQICRNSPVQLNANGGVQYTWSPGLGLSCVQCAGPLANPDSTRMYQVTGTDIHGCLSKDSLEVKVIQKLDMTQSPGTSFCVGNYTNLFANGASNYVWSPATGLSSATGPAVIAKPLVTTNYMVIGSDAFNCFKDTGIIHITVYPIPTVNAGNDITITGGSTTQISSTSTGGVTAYNWSPSTTLSCSNCPNPLAKPLKTTTYKVEVQNSGGCKKSDEVTVFVLCDKGNLFIPNTFSPNGDGMNDVLYPRGNGIYTIKTLKIFNRWGELVFEKNNFNANDPSSGWNGMFKGKICSPDVFVYMVEVFCENGTPFGFKGNISLIQ